MGKAEKSIVIRSPPEKIWEMLALDRLPEWDEGFGEGLGERVEYTSEVSTLKDKYRVGATAEGKPRKPEDDYCRFEITESLENKRIKYRAWEKTKYFGTLSVLSTYSMEPTEEGTRITSEVESEKFLGVIGELLEKLYLRRWAEKQMQKELENLKGILEE